MAQPSDPGSGPGPLRSEREEAEAGAVGLQARRSSLSTGTAGEDGQNRQPLLRWLSLLPSGD